MPSEARSIAADVRDLRAPVTTLAPTDRTQSRKLVLVSVAVLLAINVYRADREPGSLYRRLWGTGVLGVMLSLAADFAPQVAGPFAMLVALGAFSRGGDQALQAWLGKAGGLHQLQTTVGGVPAGAVVDPRRNPRAADPPAPRSTSSFRNSSGGVTTVVGP